MFQTESTPETRIAGAGALLADIRRGRRAPGPGLPPELCPENIAEAEAMQLVTYAALGWNIAGWKVGRTRGQPIAAPLPDASPRPQQRYHRSRGSWSWACRSGDRLEEARSGLSYLPVA